MIARMIELINSMIFNAESNGADAGGTYQSNEKGLYNAMKNFLTEYSLENRYEIKKTDVYDGYFTWEVFQFVLKDGDTICQMFTK